MKRIMVVDGRTSAILQDPLNQRILRQLVASELSVKKISRILDEPSLKIWRRIRSLKGKGLVEEAGVLRVRNLDVKLYRATAARYISRDSLDYEPEEVTLKQAYALFRAIQSEILDVLYRYDPVPANVNPIDFCVATDLYAYAKVMTREDTQRKLSAMLSLLEKSVNARELLSTGTDQIKR